MSLCSVALCVLTCVVAEGRRVKVRHAPVVAEAEPAFADIPRQKSHLFLFMCVSIVYVSVSVSVCVCVCVCVCRCMGQYAQRAERAFNY